MKRLIALAATLAALTTACAETGAQPLGPAPGNGSASPSSSPGGSPTTSPSESPDPTRSMTYELWFNYDGSLFVTHRTEPFTPGVGRRSLEALFDGPTDAERHANVSTSINPGTRLLDLTIDDGVATVDLDATFTAKETLASVVGSLAQVVYTLTQFDSVEGVVFEVEGSPLFEYFGRYEVDGLIQRRANFSDLLPFILVESPGIGERVSSPVTIAGTANVFEAVVSIAILDEHGRTVASTFTMATCGTGCRGSYATDVRYHVGTRQPGTLRVYEVSAMDGSPIHVVEIPVILTP
jgi:hypothetical protein